MLFVKAMAGNGFFGPSGKNRAVGIGNVNGDQVYIVVSVDHIATHCHIHIARNIQEPKGLGGFRIAVVNQVYACTTLINQEDILVNINFARVLQVFGCFKFYRVAEVSGFHVNRFISLKSTRCLTGILYTRRQSQRKAEQSIR